jgi:hypothetical protein
MGRLLPIMPTLPSLAALSTTLKRYAVELPADELPALVGELETAKAQAYARLATADRGAQGHHPPADTGRLLNAKTMAERLQVPESWLREHARGGRVPCVYVGRYMRFDPAAVIRALGEQPTA